MVKIISLRIVLTNNCSKTYQKKNLTSSSPRSKKLKLKLKKKEVEM